MLRHIFAATILGLGLSACGGDDDNSKESAPRPTGSTADDVDQALFGYWQLDPNALEVSGSAANRDQIAIAMQFGDGFLTIHAACKEGSAVHRAKATAAAEITSDRVEALETRSGIDENKDDDYECKATVQKFAFGYTLESERCLRIAGDDGSRISARRLNSLAELEPGLRVHHDVGMPGDSDSCY